MFFWEQEVEARALEKWKQDMAKWERAITPETSGRICNRNTSGNIVDIVREDNTIFVFLGRDCKKTKDASLAEYRRTGGKHPPYICATSVASLQKIYPNGRCAECGGNHSQHWFLLYSFHVPNQRGKRTTAGEIESWSRNFGSKIKDFDDRGCLNMEGFKWYLDLWGSGSFYCTADANTEWIYWSAQAIEAAYKSMGGIVPGAGDPPPKPGTSAVAEKSRELT